MRFKADKPTNEHPIASSDSTLLVGHQKEDVAYSNLYDEVLAWLSV